jgi:hypothetical protein
MKANIMHNGPQMVLRALLAAGGAWSGRLRITAPDGHAAGDGFRARAPCRARCRSAIGGRAGSLVDPLG